MIYNKIINNKKKPTNPKIKKTHTPPKKNFFKWLRTLRGIMHFRLKIKACQDSIFDSIQIFKH